ncbi:MAG: hypothetical protein R6U01_00175 [Halorubrum sp.]|uniref:DUF7344 domain-containing protein n=1 Tax=Halorubrum sp. TaxID=1879286 RepID=UPI003970A8F5
MKINNDNNSPRSFDDEQALSAVFRLLSHHRRRVTVQYLATQNDPTSVTDVVDQIALLEDEQTDTYKFQIWMSLVHIHLPLLAEAAVIKFDPDRETVELDAQAKSMRSHLGLVAAD